MASDDGLGDDVRAALATDRTIDITTIGARSGRERRIEIWFLHVDGRYFITGTPGPRDWLANLKANPRFTFHLKESVTADLAAVATEVTDGDTRRLVIEHAAATWYRGQAPLEELIERSPMVEVRFGDDETNDGTRGAGHG